MAVAGDGKTPLIDGRIFCLELDVGMVRRRAIGLVDGVVGRVGGTGYRFLSVSSRDSGLCLALDEAVGALNEERAETVEAVEAVADDEGVAADASIKDDMLAFRDSFGPSAGGVGLVDESCNRPTDFWCLRGAARGAMLETDEEPGIDKRLALEDDDRPAVE